MAGTEFSPLLGARPFMYAARERVRGAFKKQDNLLQPSQWYADDSVKRTAPETVKHDDIQV